MKTNLKFKTITSDGKLGEVVFVNNSIKTVSLSKNPVVIGDFTSDGHEYTIYRIEIATVSGSHACEKVYSYSIPESEYNRLKKIYDK